MEFESGALISVMFNGNTINPEQSLIMLYGTKGIMKVGNPDTFGGKTEVLLQDGEWEAMPFTHGYDGVNRSGDPKPYDHYGDRGLGVAELADSILAGRKNRLSGEYGLHCMEVLRGFDAAAESGETYIMKSHFEMQKMHYSDH